MKYGVPIGIALASLMLTACSKPTIQDTDVSIGQGYKLVEHPSTRPTDMIRNPVISRWEIDEGIMVERVYVPSVIEQHPNARIWQAPSLLHGWATDGQQPDEAMLFFVIVDESDPELDVNGFLGIDVLDPTTGQTQFAWNSIQFKFLADTYPSCKPLLSLVGIDPQTGSPSKDGPALRIPGRELR